ncbi:WD domain-containing protein [Cladophialophora immunda]|nr:WD domain-containing protein [Cladophialophora immunda]
MGKFFWAARTQSVKRFDSTNQTLGSELSSVNLNSRLGSNQSLGASVGEHEQPPSKKRKLSFTSISSIPSSPIKVNCGFPSTLEAEGAAAEVKDGDEAFYSETDDEDEEALQPMLRYPPRIARYQYSSNASGLLSRQLGRRKEIPFGNESSLWQHESSKFYSLPEDLFTSPSFDVQPRALPFCVASFNHQQYVAIGNEDGLVEIYRAWGRSPDRPGSLQLQSCMYPHDNAIMDMEFSDDDRLLATASGDQTCRIIDVDAQTSTHTLIGHLGSIKRVQWQPSSGNQVLATCSRDGSVCLWDLRCAQPVGTLDIAPLQRAPHLLDNSRQVNTKVEIRDAHTSWDKLKPVNGKRQVAKLSSRVDFAVTTCAFISDTRPHMLATASEHNAIIKLWDMRASYKQRTGRPTPVSATLEPESHETLRPFGVTSMTMNTDGSRLYTLCRDNTVYAYSTAHLVLGGCPEMSLTPSHPFRTSRTAGQGLGPLYGFRDPSLRLGSFYDKLALRRKTSENTELLAAGSGEDCAVIFPTDERYLTKAAQRRPPAVSHLSTSSRSTRPRLPQRTSSANVLSNSLLAAASLHDVSTEGQCPIYYTGTPLINGHRKEVTAVAWVHRNGQLVTVADDYTARCWYEDDSDKARALRMNTERDGRRSQSGWATVRQGFDDDEDEG